jgi:hypothetical protein
MHIPLVEISEDFRFPSREVVWSEKDDIKWVYHANDACFYCIKNEKILSKLELKNIPDAKTLNNVLVYVFNHSGRFPMARLAKAMGKACKAFGLNDFQKFLALNDNTPTPWNQ